MPNRYEREIEEILRNLEQTDPQPGRKPQRDNRPRPKTGTRLRQPRFAVNLSIAERLLLIAIVASMLAGGYAYITLTQPRDVLSLFLALVGTVCLILVTCSQFLFQSRRPRSYRYGNMTITPLRRSPLNYIRTQWNLLKLRLRYRRKNEQ